MSEIHGKYIKWIQKWQDEGANPSHFQYELDVKMTDELIKLYKHEISENQYNDNISDIIYWAKGKGILNKKQLFWIDRKRDPKNKKSNYQQRSFGKFYKNIFESTYKEHFLFLDWIDFFDQLGYNIKWDFLDSDGFGCTLVDSYGDPDYKAKYKNNNFCIEVKTFSNGAFQRCRHNTFKKYNLKHCCNFKDKTYLLIILYDFDNNIGKYIFKGFFMYNQTAMKKVLQLPPTLDNNFAPGKDILRINYKDDNALSILELKKMGLLESVFIDEIKQNIIFTGPVCEILNKN